MTNTLLKQLTMVLDEEGILIEKIDLGTGKREDEVRITVNDSVTISEDRNLDKYQVTSLDGIVVKIEHFSSLTASLDYLVGELKQEGVREGDILVSGNGYYTYKVIKHRIHDKYNLLNVETNQLEYMESVEPGLIHKQISAGVYVKESTENKEGSSLPELVVLLSELVYDDLTKEERDDKKLKVFGKAMDAKKELEDKGEI